MLHLARMSFFINRASKNSFNLFKFIFFSSKDGLPAVKRNRFRPRFFFISFFASSLLRFNELEVSSKDVTNWPLSNSRMSYNAIHFADRCRINNAQGWLTDDIDPFSNQLQVWCTANHGLPLSLSLSEENIRGASCDLWWYLANNRQSLSLNLPALTTEQTRDMRDRRDTLINTPNSSQ